MVEALFVTCFWPATEIPLQAAPTELHRAECPESNVKNARRDFAVRHSYVDYDRRTECGEMPPYSIQAVQPIM
jgi:hypothetical protein